MSTWNMNSSDDMIRANRRRHIAALRLRGLSQREIAQALVGQNIINHKKNKPWSLGVIHKDLKQIEDDWRAEATRDIGEHKARILAELQEVKRSAWGTKEYQAILKAISQEAKLLGVNEEQAQNLGEVVVKIIKGVSMADL